MTLNAHYQRVGMIKKAGLSSFYSVGPGHAVHALEFSHYREAYPLCQFAARDVRSLCLLPSLRWFLESRKKGLARSNFSVWIFELVWADTGRCLRRCMTRNGLVTAHKPLSRSTNVRCFFAQQHPNRHIQPRYALSRWRQQLFVIFRLVLHIVNEHHSRDSHREYYSFRCQRRTSIYQIFSRGAR